MEGGVRSLGLRLGRRRKADPSELLNRARQGDVDARNQLIQDYTPFVLKVASQKAGRFLRPGVDEEISVALLAFNEAIDAYDGKRGSFLSFSQTVIQRRLVDYFRRGGRHAQEVPLSDFESEDPLDVELTPLDRAAESAWQLRQEQEQRRLEIEEYGQLLDRYGLRLNQLPDLAPKHRDSRSRAIRVARWVIQHPQHRAALVSRGELPIKVLAETFGVSRKLIERNRRYIVAVCVMLVNDLPHLQAYLEES